jgi:hypothetical protein
MFFVWMLKAMLCAVYCRWEWMRRHCPADFYRASVCLSVCVCVVVVDVDAGGMGVLRATHSMNGELIVRVKLFKYISNNCCCFSLFVSLDGRRPWMRFPQTIEGGSLVNNAKDSGDGSLLRV